MRNIKSSLNDAEKAANQLHKQSIRDRNRIRDLEAELQRANSQLETYREIHKFTSLQKYKNPKPTVDVIIEVEGGIVLIERKNEPYGWAIPGGFVDEGEPLWEAAIREAKEETCLDIELIEQFFVYSDPKRDPRSHTMSTAFIARATGTPRAADDAKNIGIYTFNNLPELAFDHATILLDYKTWKAFGIRPQPNH